MSFVVGNLRRLRITLEALSMSAGDAVAVTGASGSGKSQLLRALADLDPNSGSVRLDGQDRNAMPAPAWRAKAAYVPATPAWWTERIADHFLNPPTAAALASVAMPGETAGWPASRLSTGESVRLALLRALERKPRVLLLDEPTGPLDAKATEAVERRLKSFRDNGGMLLLTTHETEQIARLDARVLHIGDDGVVAEAPG